jgi:DNA-binding ferritin-like protein
LGYSAYSAYAANAANATAKQQLEQARGFASEFLAAYAEIIKSCATLTAVQQLAAEDTVVVLQDIQTAIEKNTVTLPPPA